MAKDIQNRINSLSNQLNTVVSPCKYIEINSKIDGYVECLAVIHMHINSIDAIINAELCDKVNQVCSISKGKKPLLEDIKAKE